MKTITIIGATHDDCVIATGIAGKCKIVECPNPGDAASPVSLVAGDYSRSLGQSADYRHDLSDLPRIHGAGALVESYWDREANDWYTSISTDKIDEDSIRAVVRDRVARREAEAMRREKAETDKRLLAERAEAKAHTETILRDVLDVAQAWAPGQVAVRRANDGKFVVGRWNAPLIPGAGRPAEVRVAIDGHDGIALVECEPSYAFTWG